MTFFAIDAKCRENIAPTVPKYQKIKLIMRISLLWSFLTVLSTGVLLASSVKGQEINRVEVIIALNGETLTSVFRKIEQQTAFTFLYRNDDVASIRIQNSASTKLTVSDLLTQLLSGSGLTFKQEGKRIVITKLPKKSPVKNEEEKEVAHVAADTIYTITGKVTDGATGGPIQNANVSSKIAKTAADAKGVFTIQVEKGGVLRFSYIGFEPKEITITGPGSISVSLKESVQAMKDVVVNGLFTRKAETFTGSAATFSGQELKRVGNINVLQSLAILDPSFRIVDNSSAGSDPNRIPEVIVRGATSVPDLTLNATYPNAPNLPLFILDGFEATIQRIYDLPMNMVASITILKDATAKAIYGSKAGNGVVVVETIKPVAGNLRISYSSSINVTAPDLSSYHLTNSLEKIQVELLSGKYTSLYPELQFGLTQQYSATLKQALSGVDTYWLSQPLQNGVGQKHNIYIDGGNDAIRYSAGINYNGITGVMRGSDRDNISGSVSLQYRKNNFSFNNNLTIDQSKSKNSPYGNFSAYAQMNPYWKIYDERGAIIPSYNSFGATVYNPMFNSTINTKDQSQYTNITENFYAEYEAMKNLRFTGRVGVTMQNNNSDRFLPATAVEYMGVSITSPNYLNRGQYDVMNGKSSSVSSDFGAAYSFTAGKSQVFSNVFYSVQQNKNSSNGMSAVGFPNDKLDDISFGNQYLPGSKASGTESTSRNIGITSAVNYSYDNKYLADFSYRANASSQFGANKRWGSFWSAGLGWNIYREPFMKSVTFVDQLKLKGTIGTTGTQNFSSYQNLATYTYVTNQSYNGEIGLKLLSLANPDLKWQQVEDKNIGLSGSLFKRVSFVLDFYMNDTKDLISDQTVAPSAGFASYRANVGETRNQGYQINVNARLYTKAKSQTYISVFANVAQNTNKVRKVSEALQQINKQQDAILNGTSPAAEGRPTSRPVTRFAEGQSLSAIWAVPSLGIDPATGKEIFVKKDGSKTFLWNAADQVVVGDATAKYNGSFGANFGYHGLTMNFAFSYRLGGQVYNTTLVNRVENANLNNNVDVRVLEDRWKVPGDQSLYKNIADLTVTRPTSRFVQNNSELIFSSINMGYDFGKSSFIKKLKLTNLSLNMNLNDIARIGAVKTERGLDYPFARTMSLSLNANF
ncbi:SusC/RagA family TonB-linked outer membrane protein [Pedobacter frigidisoli]|uniref:SusC/RagA family TonB-linked outer membrane protein n=1 Tax=Pedobacter frigidisoli TaxID=2530455 RepID=A0A4R0NNA6_9SPHI|nr:SusC/RagA family TonB-linked outer membrane protein [Pedobacter frigidisoli]TCD00734.1 SusC/RagA family TonB-linked outer membrane protein [Pedobacter frigidisoli]